MTAPALNTTQSSSGIGGQSASASRMSCGCGSDHSPMKRPTRRPSLDCSCAPDMEENHQSDHREEVIKGPLVEDDNSDTSRTEDFEDKDDDATEVTSNQHQDISKHCSCVPKGKKRVSIAVTERTEKSTIVGSFANASFAEDLHSKPGEISFGEEEDDETYDHLDDSSNGKLTHERIRSFMVDYYEDFDSIFQASPAGETRKECMTAFVDQYFTPDFIFIRPSGNPLDGAGFATLMSEHLVVHSMKLVSIDSIHLLAGGLAAMVTFTADQKFEYKGSPQSDRTTITAALNAVNDGEEDGIIRIAHKHRSSGRPIPKDSRWA